MGQEDVAAAAAPSALTDFVAGTAGGVASLLASFPFETIRTRLILNDARAPSSALPSTTIGVAAERTPLVAAATRSYEAIEPRYRGAFDAFRVIVKEENVVGLYKGVTSPLLGVALMNAAIFGTYTLCLQGLQSLDTGARNGASEPSLAQTFLAGCGSGVLCAFITSPTDLIRIQEQAMHDRIAVPPDARGPLRRWWGTATSLWKHTSTKVTSIWKAGSKSGSLGGIQSLYRGLGVTALRDVGYGPYFWSYEMANRLIAAQHGPYTGPATSQLSALELAVSGALAGCIGWAATYPLDVVKTRYQAAPITGDLGKSPPTLLGVIKDVYRDGGSRAFFRGLSTTLVRAVPANAALFVTFEATKSALTR